MSWFSGLSVSSGAGGHDGRVRVGYLSFNFSPSRNLNGLVAGLLQRHDRARFHTWAFAIYGHHGRDTEAERRQSEDSADVFVDLLRHGARSDTDISRAINERKIHVLVDLVGLIRNHRHGILILRPAPVQVNMVYAAAVGGPSIDLFVSDRVASPPDFHGAQDPVLPEALLLLPGAPVRVPEFVFVSFGARYLPSCSPVGLNVFVVPLGRLSVSGVGWVLTSHVLMWME